jgi:hypothetical protein
VDFSRSGPYFIAFLVLTAVAFWPTYLSRMGAISAYAHLHAFTAALWMLLLIAQPAAIRARNLPWHRILGQVSYGLAPLLVLTVVLLAHSGIRGLEGEAFVAQSDVLYLQLSLAGLFGLCYGLAILERQTTPLHARFMVGTAFTLIDPVVVRLMLWADSTPGWNYRWLTFGLTDIVILVLIWRERSHRRGRWVFPALLSLFVLFQLPTLLGLTRAPLWQAISGWFAGLSLT